MKAIPRTRVLLPVVRFRDLMDSSYQIMEDRQMESMCSPFPCSFCQQVYASVHGYDLLFASLERLG
jgi:hypothetical protein